ncbi:MAG: hypothetical protein AB1553_15620 [Nitrospirota bacterium]
MPISIVKAGHEHEVRSAVEKVEGIDMLLDARSKADYHIDHPRAGTFIAVSSRASRFSYYWWEDRAKEPHFAPHVDIHRKPGYDPLELFIEPGTFKVPQDTGLIKGSHGYPPLTEQDYLPLIISGSGVKGNEIAEDLCITDVAGLIEKVLS